MVVRLSDFLDFLPRLAVMVASLDDSERNVAEIQVFALEPAERIGLGYQVSPGVVQKHTIVTRADLPEALSKSVDLVIRCAESTDASYQAPAAVVPVLVGTIVDRRAIRVEDEVPELAAL